MNLTIKKINVNDFEVVNQKKITTGVTVIQTRCKDKKGRPVIGIAVIEPKKKYNS